MKSYQVNEKGYYGEFGGAYIPEILHRCVSELQEAYSKVLDDEGFKKEYAQLLKDYVGRPSPLYLANRLSEKYGCKIYLKREDLNHTGAHKINNAIGQVLLAKRMGKTRIIAETGAGQHGVATATVCALMGMECIVYMGKTDVERQHVNVERMKMLGATVYGKNGRRTPARKRGTHEDAWSNRLPCHFRQHDSEGRHKRSHTRLVLPSCRYLLRDRLNRRPSPLSGHGGKTSVRYQRRNQEAAHGAGRTRLP